MRFPLFPVTCAHIQAGGSINPAFQLAGDSLALSRGELDVLADIPFIRRFEVSRLMDDSFHTEKISDRQAGRKD